MSIEGMAERAVELREKGLSTREICQELHLGQTTVEWLLAKQASEPEDRPPADVKAGWRSIGVSGLRMRAITEIMADIILEEQARHDFEIDVIAGVMANGVPLGTLLSDILEIDFAMVRPSREDTAIDVTTLGKPLVGSKQGVLHLCQKGGLGQLADVLRDQDDALLQPPEIEVGNCADRPGLLQDRLVDHLCLAA